MFAAAVERYVPAILFDIRPGRIIRALFFLPGSLCLPHGATVFPVCLLLFRGLVCHFRRDEPCRLLVEKPGAQAPGEVVQKAANEGLSTYLFIMRAIVLQFPYSNLDIN
jgi:hypothetical protein